jgi:hypothetical protein
MYYLTTRSINISTGAYNPEIRRDLSKILWWGGFKGQRSQFQANFDWGNARKNMYFNNNHGNVGKNT